MTSTQRRQRVDYIQIGHPALHPVDLQPGECLDRFGIVLVLVGKVDDPGQHRVQAARGGPSFHDRVDQVVGQNGRIPQGIEPFADDKDNNDGAKQQRPEQQAGAFNDIEHGRG